MSKRSKKEIISNAIQDLNNQKHCFFQIQNSKNISNSQFQSFYTLAVRNMSIFENSRKWKEKKYKEMKEIDTFYIFRDEIGFCSFQFSLDDHFTDGIWSRIPVLYLYELQIQPEAKGNGYGTRLMDLVEDIARRFGFQVTLTVLKANTKAVLFYKNRGYQNDSTCPLMHHQDASYFILSLQT